ncbi:MAG: asparagine synthase (glutamine-hydrolyzing) [bacterium]
MGGIVGAYGYYNQQPVQEGLIRKMTNTLKHRGPDERGEYHDRELALGHRRLCIIDREEGQQPLFNEDRSKVLVLDGEIYNYRELQQYLRGRGHYFQTDSDAEVALHLYEEKGVQFLGDLQGMFSLALWDKKARQLVLARDQLGIKPLYYCSDGYRLLFASQIRALFQDRTVDRELNPRSLADYLTYLYVPAPKSIFLGIYKIPPGYYLLCSPEGYVVRKYWDLELPSQEEEGSSWEEYQHTLLDLLSESISSHLPAGMPAEVFLSGGLDSATLLAVGHRLGADLRAYTLGFDGSDMDERPFSRLLAHYFDIPYREWVGNPKMMLKRLDQVVQSYDEPLGDAATVLTYEMARQAAGQHTRVALSGEGGGMIFTPCCRYGLNREDNCIQRLWSDGMVNTYSPGAGSCLGVGWIGRLLQRQPGQSGASLARTYFNSLACFSAEEIHRLLSRDFFSELRGYDPFVLFHDLYQKAASPDPCSRLHYVEMKSYLPDNVLAKVDRAGMANSLEIRLPLLNHRLVEFLVRVPVRFRLKGTEERYLLRKTLEGILPSVIVWRREQKADLLFRNLLLDDSCLTEEDLGQSSHCSLLSEILNFDEITSIRQHHRRGNRDYSRQMWAVLFLCKWYRQYMSRTTSNAREEAEPSLVVC